MGGLRKYIRPFFWVMGLTAAVKLFGAAVELLIPYLLEQMIDRAVPAGELRGILLCGGGMVLCACLCVSSNILANRTAARSAGKITEHIRHDLFARLDTLSAKQLDDLTIPSAVSRLTSDTYNVNQLLAKMQRLGIRAPMLLMGGIFMSFMIDRGLALALLATLPMIAVVVYFVTKTSIPLYTKEQGILDRMVRVVQENVTGIRVIKALSKTEYERERFSGVNRELADTDLKVGSVTALSNPVTSLILNLGLTVVVILGAYRVNSGLTKPGVILAFLNYFTMILNAMLGVTKIFIIWSKGEASAKRVVSVLHLPEEMQVEEPEGEEGAYLEFRDVSFSYSGVTDDVSHVSFTLQKGQTLGILGGTGSGKSTLVQLLLRFYDPREGSIFARHRDIRTIPQEEFRGLFGVVFQNDFFMEGSIRENIRFFRDISDADVETAANHAQAGFIEDKEGGMEHSVAVRGNDLSGGQKQRLLISRALAGNPEILILDDASSALDYGTDAALRRSLAREYAKTTKVIVAQRISSIRHADLILVLDGGKIIGRGKHEDLLLSCPMYAEIASNQMGQGEVRHG